MSAGGCLSTGGGFGSTDLLLRGGGWVAAGLCKCCGLWLSGRDTGGKAVARLTGAREELELGSCRFLRLPWRLESKAVWL